MTSVGISVDHIRMIFLTNFYHSFGSHHITSHHMFGDNVMSVSNISGDLFRKRHDIVKTVINSFCLTSGVSAECEVFGLFRDIIPVEALGEEEGLERGRGRQVLLPDFRLELPSQAEPEL